MTRTDAPEGATTTANDNPNADTIRGLREVADFLEEHPELPRLRGFIHAYVYEPNARAALEGFARHAGPAPTEKTTDYGDVVINREFASGVDVELRASVKSLGGVVKPQPVIEYEPILGARAEQ